MPEHHQNANQGIIPSSSNGVTPSQQAITELVGVMQTVDVNSPQARQNETSMDDNNGGRITYTENIADKIF